MVAGGTSACPIGNEITLSAVSSSDCGCICQPANPFNRIESEMAFRSFLIFFSIAFGLSGCLASDTERGLAGAAGGAVIGGVTGGNPVTGAVIGGAAGYFCRDLNVPGCRKN
jgi:osmotically inducible lipoprotein OsmB